MKVRLYGPKLGQGSFTRVTAGMKQGLEACGVLAGYVPIDVLDEDTNYEGHDAEVGVWVGPPAGVTVMQSKGWHKDRLVLFPPNSTWVPKHTLKILEQYATGLIAPSAWARSTLEANTPMPIHLWHHGVSSAFKEAPALSEAMRSSNEDGIFSAVHFASTSMQRKGTRELIEAWGRLVNRGMLGRGPLLNLVVDGSQDDFSRLVCASTKTPSSIQWRGRQNLVEYQSAIAYQSHHAVIQPSRGEGFGLVPLEAQACGVPTIMTACTGHLDFAQRAHLVSVGLEEPIDDGPGAKAPSVSVSVLADSIYRVFNQWQLFKTQASEAAPYFQENWSWERKTQEWLERMKGIST